MSEPVIEIKTEINGIPTDAKTDKQKELVSRLAFKASEMGRPLDNFEVRFAGNKVEIIEGSEHSLFSMKVAQDYIDSGFVDPEELERQWMEEFESVITANELSMADVTKSAISAARKSDESPSEAAERIAGEIQDKKAAEEAAAAEKLAKQKEKEEEAKKAEAKKLEDAKKAGNLQKDVEKSVTKQLMQVVEKEAKGLANANNARWLKGQVFLDDLNRINELAKLDKSANLTSLRKYGDYIRAIFPDHREKGVSLSNSEISLGSKCVERWIYNLGLDIEGTLTIPFTIDPVTKAVVNTEKEIKVIDIGIAKASYLSKFVTPSNAPVLAAFADSFPEKFIEKIIKFFDEEKDNAADMIMEYVGWYDPEKLLGEAKSEDEREVEPTSLTDLDSLNAYLEQTKKIPDNVNLTTFKTIKVDSKVYNSLWTRAYNLMAEALDYNKKEFELTDSKALEILLKLYDTNRLDADGADVGKANILNAMEIAGVLTQEESGLYYTSLTGLDVAEQSEEGEEASE